LLLVRWQAAGKGCLAGLEEAELLVLAQIAS